MNISINNKCPICESEAIKKYRLDAEDFSCDNGCYVYQEETLFDDFVVYRYYVVGTLHDYYSAAIDEEKQRVREQVIKDIKYWKENSRYLMELMK